MQFEIGTRVVLIAAADRQIVTIYGFGRYAGREIPPEYARYLGAPPTGPTAKIKLDDGNVAYGSECFWTPANRGWQKFVGKRKLKRIAIDEARVSASQRYRIFGKPS